MSRHPLRWSTVERPTPKWPGSRFDVGRWTLDVRSGAWPDRLLGLSAAVLLLGGCATTPHTALVSDPVGPLTGAPTSAFTRPTGYLEVHTETEPYNDGGFVYYRHTPYSVYDAAGRRVKSVVNRIGMTDQRPMTVPLPAGEYRIYARAEGYGVVEVPVVIVGTRLTEVHLERGGMKSFEAVPESARVHLPDGRVVGRRAEGAAKEPGR